MEKIFNLLFNIFQKRKWLFAILVLFVFVVCGYFALRIRVAEDISRFIPDDKKIEKLNYVFQHLKSTDKLVITIYDEDSSHSSPEALIAYADSLTAGLQKAFYPGYIREIRYRVSDEEVYRLYDVFYQNLPVFLEEKDYLTIDSLISPERIPLTLKKDYQSLMMPGSFALKKYVLNDPLSFVPLVLNKMKKLKVDESYVTYDGCIFSRDMKNLMLFIVPANPANETAKNSALIKGIDQQIEKLSSGNSLRVSRFGAVAVAVGNANQLKRDTTLTLSIAIVVIVAFIGIFFRKKFAWTIILLPVVFGALFSLAILSFIKPEVSAIALAAGSVILGIAINYSLHVYSHYSHTGSARSVLNDLSNPLTIGSFTTIAAFLCLTLTRSDALRDFGLFSAFTLIGTILFTLVVMPHMLERIKIFHSAKSSFLHSFIERLSIYHLPRQGVFIIIVVAVSAVLFYFSFKVGFESDMLKMNYMSQDLQKAEKRLNSINKSASGSLFLVSTGKNLDEALAGNEKTLRKLSHLEKEGTISNYTQIGSLLVSDSMQKVRIARWNAFWTPEKKTQLLARLNKAGKPMHFTPKAFSGIEELVNTAYHPLSKDDREELSSSLLSEWITETPEMSMVLTQLVLPKGERQKIHTTFSGDNNLVVLDKSYYTNQFIRILSSDFNTILWLSSLLVFFTLLLSYGRIELALITFLPMLLSWVWITGFMGIFGLGFNIINIIICTFIFGLGDDYSIFIMDGMQQEYKYGKKLLPSYKTAIFLSAFTTIVGVGVLIFAKHPALHSIAMVSIIGMISVVFIAYTIEPLMFNFLIKIKNRFRSEPTKLIIILYAPIFYGFYILGCMLVLLLWFLVFCWLPVGKARRKLWMHYLMMYLSRATIYVMFLVRKRIIHFDKNTFKKPAVIIFNHQSIIDIPLTMMFTPKIIILTTDWVWNHPLVGRIARIADFYPVSSGIDDLLGKLRAKVDKGYSILMFPEGHRSPDLTIKRFHNGAFYLAEKLHLDILPAVFHGTGEYVSKGEFLGKASTITVKFLNRIHPEDTSFGVTPRERAKSFCRLFRQEHSAMLQEFYLTPEYQRKRVIKNYLYKGPVLEWYVRVKLTLEKNYSLYHTLLPKEGEILDLGCGYGYMSLMMGLLSPKREILAVDFDENKIALAQNCHSAKQNVRFVYADVAIFELPSADGIILSDVLHYLSEKEQEMLLQNCIDRLNPRGVLLVRDADSDNQKQHSRTRFTEFFSNNTGFNKSRNNQLYFTPASKIEAIAKKNSLEFKIFEKSRFTSNQLLVITKNRI